MYIYTSYSPELISGKKTKLSNDQEKRLCTYIKFRSKIGYGVTKLEIPLIIKDIRDKAEKELNVAPKDDERLFSNNLPHKSWVHRFIARHDDLRLRTPENLGHMRKQVSEAKLRNWFHHLEEFLCEEHDIQASEFLVRENSHRVFNLDETGFPLSSTNKLKVISEKEVKNVYSVTSESKSQITVLGCVSASGTFQKHLSYSLEYDQGLT